MSPKSTSLAKSHKQFLFYQSHTFKETAGTFLPDSWHWPVSDQLWFVLIVHNNTTKCLESYKNSNLTNCWEGSHKVLCLCVWFRLHLHSKHVYSMHCCNVQWTNSWNLKPPKLFLILFIYLELILSRLSRSWINLSLSLSRTTSLGTGDSMAPLKDDSDRKPRWERMSRAVWNSVQGSGGLHSNSTL